MVEVGQQFRCAAVSLERQLEILFDDFPGFVGISFFDANGRPDTNRFGGCIARNLETAREYRLCPKTAGTDENPKGLGN